MHQHGLHGIAGSRPLDLGIKADLALPWRASALQSTYTWQMPLSCLITGIVEFSDTMRISPSPPRGMMRSTNPFSLSISMTQARSGFSMNDTAPSGMPASAPASRQDVRDRSIGMHGFGAAPEQHAVAGFEAECSGISGHVRPRFVDDPDEPDGHAHLADLHAIGPAPHPESLLLRGREAPRPRADRQPWP